MLGFKKTTQEVENAPTQHDAITAAPAQDFVDVEEELKQPEPTPRPEDQLDSLGIPNWRELEKQVVRRLDFTLMPCLWCLYLFNYREYYLALVASTTKAHYTQWTERLSHKHVSTR